MKNCFYAPINDKQFHCACTRASASFAELRGWARGVQPHEAKSKAHVIWLTLAVGHADVLYRLKCAVLCTVLSSLLYCSPTSVAFGYRIRIMVSCDDLL
jgi:hypothetical protein